MTDSTRDYKLLYEQAEQRCEQIERRCAEIEAGYEKKLHTVKNKLEKLRAGVDEEMEIAKSVQAGLLPKELPEFVNLQTCAVYIPTGKVGGDLYDIILTPTQKIAILIFDVSGHGVPAALIAAMAKMLFAHYIEKIESPSVIFNEVNRRLCTFINTDHYLTAFLGVLDPIRNVMIYSRAGHVRPVVYRAAGSNVELLGGRGFFLGHSALLDIAEYSEESVELSPGDKVLFYTDGLTEGSNSRNELYGVQRLLDSVAQNGSGPLQQLLDRICEDQQAFRDGYPLRDDFSILCIETTSSEWLLKDSGFSAADEPRVLMVSTYVDIEQVCSLILRAMDENGFGDNDIKHAKICVFEMLMNAIEHGNGRDPHKKAIVLYTVHPEELKISVTDEGAGFDYCNVPDPLAPENILKDHGRGVFIIREYMDDVQFNEKGNRILAVKRHNRGEGHGAETGAA